MTESELKLFTGFLKEKMPKSPNSRSTKEPDENTRIPILSEETKQDINDAFNSLDFVHENYKDKSAIHKLNKHQRMSKRFIQDKNDEFKDLHNTKNKVDLTNPSTYTKENLEHDASLGARKANAHLRTSNILYNEELLKRSGYDDKYAARGLEKVLGKRISGDEAERIVNNRIAMDEANQAENHGDLDGGLREVSHHLGHRWDDAKMVYGEALNGRSLGKDAAIAAGAATAIGITAGAIKRAKKKKQLEREIAESKYKTKK